MAMGNTRKIMIVDDSEVDRLVLENMLEDEFEVIIKDNGVAALDMLRKKNHGINAIMLDVSMPGLDGFGVLRALEKIGQDHIPVFLITAEATKGRVEEAAQYHVSDFIKKPFDREEIVRRLRTKLGLISRFNLTDADIRETEKYIASLEYVFEKCLSNMGLDEGHYMRMYEIMKIMLKRYSKKHRELDSDHIELISQAARFCDIGYMVYSAKYLGGGRWRGTEKELEGHTVFGSEMIQWNNSQGCRFFMEICSDMCLHHHERYDGKGYPHKIKGDNILIYTQFCRIADVFDDAFSKFNEVGANRFDYVVKDIRKDEGAFGDAAFSVFLECKDKIIRLYQTMEF